MVEESLEQTESQSLFSDSEDELDQKDHKSIVEVNII